MSKPATLTVGELIDQLSKFDRSRLVLGEGCSCPYAHPVIGADEAKHAEGVVIDEFEENTIVIRIDS